MDEYLVSIAFHRGKAKRLQSLDTSTDNETKRTFLAIAKMTYISVSVWRDQQYTHYIFLDAMIA